MALFLFLLPNGLELSCPAEAGSPYVLYGKLAGDAIALSPCPPGQLQRVVRQIDRSEKGGDTSRNPLIVNLTPRSGRPAKPGSLTGVSSREHSQLVSVKFSGMKQPVLRSPSPEVGEASVLVLESAQEPLYWAITEQNEGLSAGLPEFPQDLADACLPGRTSWGQLKRGAWQAVLRGQGRVFPVDRLKLARVDHRIGIDITGRRLRELVRAATGSSRRAIDHLAH